MGMIVSYYSDEGRLDITIDENLDLTQTRQILMAQDYIDDQLTICVIDCSRMVGMFDSGRALMLMFLERLARFRVRLLVIGDLTGLSYPFRSDVPNLVPN